MVSSSTSVTYERALICNNKNCSQNHYTIDQINIHENRNIICITSIKDSKNKTKYIIDGIKFFSRNAYVSMKGEELTPDEETLFANKFVPLIEKGVITDFEFTTAIKHDWELFKKNISVKFVEAKKEELLAILIDYVGVRALNLIIVEYVDPILFALTNEGDQKELQEKGGK